MDGLILVNKESGQTSYDVIKLVKKMVNSRKVGHCGTLDPFASGLLIIGVNQGTKVMNYLEHDYKEYEAIIKLGSFTDSYDLTGNTIETKKIVKVDKQKVNEILKTFIGKIKQTPPIYSSIHVNGKHLYEYARENIEVEIPTREIEIYDLKLLDLKDDEIKIYVKCSRGTYIRTLGVDIAAKLDNVGHLSYLKRLSIGNISLDQACLLTDIENKTAKIYQIDEVINFKKYEANDKQLIRIYNGQSIKINDLDCDRILLMDSLTPCAIYLRHDDGYYYCERGLYNEEIRFKRLKELKG